MGEEFSKISEEAFKDLRLYQKESEATRINLLAKDRQFECQTEQYLQ